MEPLDMGIIKIGKNPEEWKLLKQLKTKVYIQIVENNPLNEQKINYQSIVHFSSIYSLPILERENGCIQQ